MNNPLAFKTLVMVALGGALGATMRAMIGDLFHQSGPTGFPFYLVIVNILGCLYLGFVAGLVECKVWHPRQQWIQGSGIAGALTTFSAMAAASVELWLNQQYLAVAGFLLLQLVLGLAVCMFAMFLVSNWHQRRLRRVS
ncbi:fluoride efflux transporter FluC [Aliidiomarina quisquiliarum]|uniref:fluoride efflux transporter FluC n=1 Tax=Aliidiomarina quisquiliarum TaxID=2938947 RepID=UPI00208F9C6B|nr:CrcB family protein [Aliidiomarina quisquiliarum]MCO4320785.1 CrcB family protein [Aliidiomarina quisquiliarum]